MAYATKLVVVVTFHSILAAHIDRAECWEKSDKRIYCLADCHDAEFEKNCVDNEHRRDILKGARAFDAPLIVEDPEGLFERVGESIVPVAGSRSLIAVYDRLKRDYAVPMGMASLCYRAGVPVANVEFRFLSASDRSITMKEELDCLHTRAEKILHYDDGEDLKLFYVSVVKRYRDIIHKEAKVFFDYVSQKNKTIAPCDIYYAPCGNVVDFSLKKIFPRNYLENLNQYDKKKLLLKHFKTYLVDAEIVHAVAQNKDKKRIIVCAGNAHIQRIAPALKAMGYVQTDVCVGDSNAGTWESDAIDLDAFFAKHEPRYAAGEGEKTYVDYLLDMQCYCDNHPLVAFTAGITAGVASLCAALGVITSPFWCATIARNVAPHSPNARFVIEKSLLAAVMATTGFSLHTLFSSLRSIK